MEELCCRITYGKILALIYSTEASESPSWCFHPKHPEGMCLKRLAGLSPRNFICRAARLQLTSFETSETGDIGFEGGRNVLAVGTVGIVEAFSDIVGTEVASLPNRRENLHNNALYRSVNYGSCVPLF
jgi:hypothetical protein